MSNLNTTEATETPAGSNAGLQRSLGLTDSTLIVIGGILGTSIFVVPHIVAQQVRSPLLFLSTWVLGGLAAIGGAFIYAELAARLPKVGGQYAYFREAYGPGAAFVYGWTVLLVEQTGAMAGVAAIFARYFVEATHVKLSEGVVATIAILLLTAVNCLGVKVGSSVQNVLTTIKVLTIATLIVCGFAVSRAIGGDAAATHFTPVSLSAYGSALVPVLFSYGGVQSACFLAGEIRNPRRNLPRALIFGVLGVVTLYLLVNLSCMWALGINRLAATSAPAWDVMQMALGNKGALLMSAGITIAALGYLSQASLTAPRVYFAMAKDGLFFKQVAWINPKTHVPIIAIVLQGVWACGIALSGRYEQILNFVMSVEALFLIATALTLFVFRRREKGRGIQQSLEIGSSTGDETQISAHGSSYRMPGHPYTTFAYIVIYALVAVSLFIVYPANTATGVGICLSGIPVYIVWKWLRAGTRQN